MNKEFYFIFKKCPIVKISFGKHCVTFVFLEIDSEISILQTLVSPAVKTSLSFKKEKVILYL